MVVKIHVIAEIGADRRIRRQGQDAVRRLRQTEFGRRADHAQRFDAAQLGALDPEVARQDGADGGHRHLHAGDVPGPHTICDGASAPMSTLQTLSLSASGCCSRVSTSPTTTPLNIAAAGFDRIDFQTGHAQLVGQLVGTDVGIRPTRATRLR